VDLGTAGDFTILAKTGMVLERVTVTVLESNGYGVKE
jgi:hypothetical protein